MPNRRTRLARRWHDQMVALLAATDRPWKVDELLGAVCGRRPLSAVEREAAADALARLFSRPDVRHGSQPPPSSNGRAA